MKLNDTTQTCNHIGNNAQQEDAKSRDNKKPLQNAPRDSDANDDDAVSESESESSSSSGSGTDNSEFDDIPSEFLCPLTLEIMTDPVMDKQGMNFERAAIAKWLQTGNTTHPLTREPLSFSKLVSNAFLRKKISEWRRQQGLSEEAQPGSSTQRLDDGDDYSDLDPSFFMGTIEAPLHSDLGVIWREQVQLYNAYEVQDLRVARTMEPSRRQRRRPRRRRVGLGRRVLATIRGEPVPVR